MIDISQDQLQTIQVILKRHVPHYEVRAFGSRFTWTAKDYSDLDLAIVGPGKLAFKELSALKTAFEESDLPYRVEVLDWHAISPEFQKVIEQGYEVIQKPEFGMRAQGWKKYNLEDVLDALIDYRGKTPSKTAFGIPLITAKIVKNGFIQQPEEFIAEEDYNAWMVRGLPQVGDVVLTTEAPLGEVAQIKDNQVAFAQRIITLRGKSGVLNNGYLKYFLQSEIGQARLKERETGTTVTGIKQSQLRLVKIDLPPIAIQRRIASILSALDEKIELNRQTNATLEAIAQAIFKEWFVDFNFPGATGEIQESEMGPIPKTWRVAKWGELLSLEYGKSLRSYRDYSGPYPVFGTNGKIGMHSGPLCPHPGIIIGRKGAYRGVHFSESPFFVIDTAFFVKPLVPMELRWAYYEIARLDINSMDSGSAIPSTSREDFYGIPVVTPPVAVQQTFCRLLAPHWERQQHVLAESQILSSLRDTLLPKLMSGEIEV